MSSGHFIVLEGVDGAGTTTQAELLGCHLKALGQEALVTAEPTSGPIGALLREALSRRLVDPQSGAPYQFDWATMALLFAADRRDHSHRQIGPALRAQTTVVSDRYDLSSLAYQSLTAPPGVEVVSWIRKLNERAVRPHLTLVLDVSVEEAQARRRARGGPEEIFEALELQRRLAAVYEKAEALVPQDRLLHISGEGTVEEVAERIWACVVESGAAERRGHQ